MAAAAPVQPLAWELPHAAGVAIKKKKKKIVHEGVSKHFKSFDLIIPFVKFHRWPQKLSQ